MPKLSLMPTNDHIVLKMDERRGEHKNAAGLYVPATGEEAPIFGTVLAVGPGTRLDNGEYVPIVYIAPNDRVVVPKYAGALVTIDETEFTIVRASEILAVAVTEE